MRLAVLLLAVLLTACKEEVRQWTADQCMRAELFQACMKSLPAGPTSTQYNDWDEVVHQCERASYYMSIRKPQFVKPECQ